MGCNMSMDHNFGSFEETFGSALLATSWSFQTNSLCQSLEYSKFQNQDDLQDVCLIDSSLSYSPSPPPPLPRRVTFQTHAHIREYKIVIGDHPCCQDSLPLSLDWSYEELDAIMIHQTGRLGKYSPPKRLTYLERKIRLQQVGGLSEETLCQQERLHLEKQHDTFWGNTVHHESIENQENDTESL